MKTPAAVVISELGVRPLARSLGLSPSAVIKWRKRSGFVPPKHHKRILELAEGRLSYEDLVVGR